MDEITINLQNTDITEMEIERIRDREQSIQFSVKGTVENVDGEIIQDAFEAQSLNPISITVETDTQS